MVACMSSPTTSASVRMWSTCEAIGAPPTRRAAATAATGLCSMRPSGPPTSGEASLRVSSAGRELLPVRGRRPRMSGSRLPRALSRERLRRRRESRQLRRAAALLRSSLPRKRDFKPGALPNARAPRLLRPRMSALERPPDDLRPPQHLPPRRNSRRSHPSRIRYGPKLTVEGLLQTDGTASGDAPYPRRGSNDNRNVSCRSAAGGAGL